MCCARVTPCLAVKLVTPEAESKADSGLARVPYRWNLHDVQRPLLNLAAQVKPDIDLALTYPLDRFAFPILQVLAFDAQSAKYTLQLLPAPGGAARSVDLPQTGFAGHYASTDGSNLRLIDNKGVQIIRTRDETEYTFVHFTDGTIRCIRVKANSGSLISLVYTRDNLIHALVDSSGRTLEFNYEGHHLASITQTWTVNGVLTIRNWYIGTRNDQGQYAPVRYVPAAVITSTKLVPNNAITPEYTSVMEHSDRLLASIFGGPGAVAAANGFEPIALGDQYPLYRGDITADDGRVLRGHLSFAMHLYGNANGTGDSALYVPAGFTSHSNVPSPTDAVITFYYPRLGNLTNVTLAVFHVANFQIVSEGARVRIGNIGGPGGDTLCYKHSHIEFYLGNTGLPASTARPSLRIDPATVFGTGSAVATNHHRSAPRSSF
jgi:hypothetical protein